MARINEAHLRFNGDGHARLEGRGISGRKEAESHLAEESFAFRRALPPDLADLLDLAMAVYLADRVVRRRPEGLDPYEFSWKRRLILELPVRLPERWNRLQVQEALTECLAFLTEDEWTFKFVHRQRERRFSERQSILLPVDLRPPVEVALFSGGLDSLAGVAASLAEPSLGTLLLVSGVTNPRLKSVVESLTRDAFRVTGRDVRPLILPLGLRQAKKESNRNERSQRTRGFLYGTLGAVAAAIAGAVEVLFYENGIGAINLPYSPVQIGSHSTRATNPVALAYLADFLELFLDRPIDFRLPFLFSTKGEMCARFSNSNLRDSIATSVTCDSFPLRTQRAAQCGVCTSCLLRRQALVAAGLAAEDPGDLYFYDVIGRPSELQDKRWHGLRDMLGQVDTFRRAVASPDPWLAFGGVYPMLRDVAWTLEERRITPSLSEAQAKLMSLLERYSAEWDVFPARPPGWRFGTPDPTNDWRLRHAC